MNKGSSSSHARRQGAARWKQGWNDAWTGWDDSSATTSAIAESIPDERLTNAKHVMQDQLQQTGHLSEAFAENAHRASRIKDEGHCRL